MVTHPDVEQSDTAQIPKTGPELAFQALAHMRERCGDDYVIAVCHAAGISSEGADKLINELKIRAASAKFDVELAEALGFTNDLMAADLLPPTSRT